MKRKRKCTQTNIFKRLNANSHGPYNYNVINWQTRHSAMAENGNNIETKTSKRRITDEDYVAQTYNEYKMFNGES